MDAGEDLNNNGKLDPRPVATFDSGGLVKTVETDANGFADFFIVYAKEFAFWVDVQLIATASVAGSEGRDQRTFMLTGLAADYQNVNNDPPGNPSPFGRGNTIAWTEDTNSNGTLDPAEDTLILENGRLDTEDLNGNGILDAGEDGTIFSHLDKDGNPVFTNPREGQLDTEDLNGNGKLDPTEDINNNGILDIRYLNTCDTTS